MNDLKEIGGFIVSADPYVNHNNSLSGNGTLTSPLGVVPGYNETVLWSGDITSTANKITLSEPFTNFERQGVYWKCYERRFYSEFANTGTDNTFCVGAVYVLNAGTVEKSCTTWTPDSISQLSYKNTSHGSITASGTSFNTNVVPYKIVGINRKQ